MPEPEERRHIIKFIVKISSFSRILKARNINTDRVRTLDGL